MACVSHVLPPGRVDGALPDVRGTSLRLRRVGFSAATACSWDRLRTVRHARTPRGVMGGAVPPASLLKGKEGERPGLPFPIPASSSPLLFVLLGGRRSSSAFSPSLSLSPFRRETGHPWRVPARGWGQAWIGNLEVDKTLGFYPFWPFSRAIACCFGSEDHFNGP